jgi:hypothetical protein
MNSSFGRPTGKECKGVGKDDAHSVPEVQKRMAALPANTLVHGITVGDIAWDDLNYFNDYNKAVEQMGIHLPVWESMIWITGREEMKLRRHFQNFYGPTYYSFNRGMVALCSDG